MSIITADFPSDSRGLYGTESAKMLDGLWAEHVGNPGIEPDPDPNIGSNGAVHFGTSGSSGSYSRLILPSTRTTLGIARRLWMSSLPSKTTGLGSTVPRIATFATAANAAIATVWVTTTGGIVVSAGDGTSGTILGQTLTPVLTAASWGHIEVKMSISATVGTVEVRVNGTTVINETDLNTGTNPIGQLWFGTWVSGSAGAYRAFLKDLVIWDTLGTVNNNFLGQVTVLWRGPSATIDNGGWVSNAGVDTDETLRQPLYANTLTASGVISSGNQIRINSTYYNWTSGAVNTGTPAGTGANPWLVAMGANTAEALANMYAAIGATGVAGTTYSSGVIAHTTAKPFGLTATTISVAPIVPGTVSMTFSETGANTSWLSTSAFTLKIHDAIRVSAGYISAVSATGSVIFTGLPVADETVTINGQVYTFKAAAAGALEVTIGADADATAVNFAAKVNANSIIVTAIAVAGTVNLTAISTGVAGNSFTLAESATNTEVSDATLTGGVDVTYPAAAKVSLEPLPDDVTSVRAVIPIVRAAKVDGGDGNLQISFGASEASYDDGTNTPITTAFTYWGNPTMPFVSEFNPLTAAPWSAGEFNFGARIKINRTL